MTDLAHRLLASIENHGRSAVTGIYKLYPHESKAEVLAAITELIANGWVKMSFKTVELPHKPGKPKMYERVEKNVWRTNKQMYSQPNLIQ